MCRFICPKWSFLCPFTCTIPAHVPFQDGDESGHPRMSTFISVLKRDMCAFGTWRADACALREHPEPPMCSDSAQSSPARCSDSAHAFCMRADAQSSILRGSASENKKAGRCCYLPARSFWWSRGESAYPLRGSASASGACAPSPARYEEPAGLFA